MATKISYLTGILCFGVHPFPQFVNLIHQFHVLPLLCDKQSLSFECIVSYLILIDNICIQKNLKSPLS